MIWHVICRAGKSDDFLPALKPRDLRLIAALAGSMGQHQVSNNVIPSIYENGLELRDLEIDLLHFAMAVYTADLRIPRSTAEDRWAREITLYLPVAEPDQWVIALPTISRMLSFLTGDKWKVQLRERRPITLPIPKSVKICPSLVALFSGGLDSFAGAIDLLEDSDGLVALVGQYGKGSTHPSQIKSHQSLDKYYPERTQLFDFYVQPSKIKDQEDEDTMRSRSILFLALGTAVASACGGGTPLYVAENGLISLNVPLTYSRMGSLSTRTTHPHFISLYREMLNALQFRVSVELPYRFLTKGEMLKGTKNQAALREGLPFTLSCSRPDAGRFQRRPPGTHCGYCVPCIIRLASMKAANFEIKGAAYIDVTKKKLDPDKPAGRDLRAFQIAVERAKTLRALQLVGDVLQTGPLPPSDIREYADVYRRGIKEVGQFLQSNRKN